MKIILELKKFLGEKILGKKNFRVKKVILGRKNIFKAKKIFLGREKKSCPYKIITKISRFITRISGFITKISGFITKNQYIYYKNK